MKLTNVAAVPLEQVEMPGAVGCAYRVALSARDGALTMAMRFFEIAPGGHSPLHQHPYEHEVFILAGNGTVWCDGREIPLGTGTVLLVAADEQHQFKNTGDTTLQFLCLIPAQFQKC